MIHEPDGTDSCNLFILDRATGTLRFTPAGEERYRARFGKAGIDIRAIRTHQGLVKALEKTWDQEWDGAIAQIQARTGEDPSLDRQLLNAVLAEDGPEIERLEALIGKREAIGLRIVPRE